MVRPVLTLGLLAAAACKVVDAPDSLEAMMVFGFTHVEPGPEIQATADDLPDLIRPHEDELEAGYRVDSLTRADLREAGVEGRGKVEIVGAMGRVLYTHDLDEVLDAITHRHRDRIAENTTAYEVLSDSDRACFLAHDCETYTQTATQVTQQPIVGELTQTFTQDWVWVESQGREAVASRVLAPDPVSFSSGLARVDQQYTFYLVTRLPGGGTERVESLWAEASLLGADLPDSFLVDSAVKAMGDQAERVDAWIDDQR